MGKHVKASTKQTKGKKKTKTEHWKLQKEAHQKKKNLNRSKTKRTKRALQNFNKGKKGGNFIKYASCYL